MTGRRGFLKKISLGSLSMGLLPGAAVAAAVPRTEATCEKTTLDYYGQGPFYKASAPQMSQDQLADAGEPGTRLILTGRVYNLDCSEAIPDVEIDVWHADDAGDYDNAGFKLRGITKSNSQGFYTFETIKPGKYLNGSKYRPSHIHFKITPPGKPTMTTQLYFEGDSDIPADAAASINSGQFDATHRIIPLTMNGNGKYEGVWDIVVDGDGISLGGSQMHLEHGMIYQAQPNPIQNNLEVHFGVFRAADVAIMVYDMDGRQVGDLGKHRRTPGKYVAHWEPSSSLPQGSYFVILSLDGLQVHYLKVLRTK